MYENALFRDQFVRSQVYDDRVHANVNNTWKFDYLRLNLNKRLVGGSMFEPLFLVKQLTIFSLTKKRDHFDAKKVWFRNC